MNRTERAIKKKCRLAMNAKKAEKNRAIAEMKDALAFHGNVAINPDYLEVNRIVKDEKCLKSWHRKTISDYTSRKNKLEVAIA